MRTLKLLTLFLVLGMVTGAFAQPVQQSWGSLKTTYLDGTHALEVNKIMFPSPWPFPYHRDPSIDETSAMMAMMKVGLAQLTACSQVLVMSSTSDHGESNIALVEALRPDGRQGVWVVDVENRFSVQELVVTSTKLGALGIENLTTGTTITDTDINAAAQEDYNQVHLAGYANLFPGEVGEDGFWGKVKKWWNSMNLCQQVTVVAGLVVCGTADLAVVGNLICGTAFCLSYAQC